MSHINYIDILKRSWKITWNNKHLWWFGLFITLASGGSFNYRGFGSNEQSKNLGEQIMAFTGQHLAIVLFAGLALLIIFIILGVLSIISRGALIRSAHKITEGTPITFKAGFAFGKKYFWRIFAISVVLSLIALLIIFVMAIPIVFLFISHSNVLGAILTLLGIILFIPLMILLAYLRIFGTLYVVLGDLAIQPALENAYALFRKNIISSIVMSLVFLITGIIFCFALLIALIPLALIFAIIALVFYLLLKAVGLYIIAGLGIITAIVLFIAARSIYETFIQTAWVLFFYEIAKPKIAETVPEAVLEIKPVTDATPNPVTFSEE